MAQQKDYKKFYNGLKGVRNAGFNEPLTQDQLFEIFKCADDPEFFIEKYVKIISKPDDRFIVRKKVDNKNKITKKRIRNKGLISFKLRDYQKNLIREYYENNRIIIKFPRQAGKSVTIQAICVHLAVFHNFRNIAVLANKDKSAKKFLSQIKLMIKNLPFWMQPGVIEWNKTSIQFDNNSSITSAATSADGIRGDSCTDLILDEAAFVDNNMWAEFYASIYPVVSADEDAKIVIISTPNGMNHFYKFWCEAFAKISGYIALEIKWNDVPGRDEAWRIKTIAEFGERHFMQEFCCEFLGSGGSLLSTKALQSMGIDIPIETRDDENFRIYIYPKENHNYALLVDTGEGVGCDASTVQIIDVTDTIWEQVAVYESNAISVEEFPGVIESIGLMYNEALVIAENNIIGNDVLVSLVNDYEYENVFFSSDIDKHRHGIRMTGPSKKVGNSTLKRYIEDGKILIRDEKTIFQFSVYVKKGETYKADSDYHDDLVTPFVIFSIFARNKEWFSDWLVSSNLDERRKKLQEKIMEDLIPAGFVNRGNGNIDLNDYEEDDDDDEDDEEFIIIERDDELEDMHSMSDMY